METAAKHLSIETTDRTVALQLSSPERGCILTRLSPVTGKERAFALVPQGPGNACSHDTLVGGWSSVAVLCGLKTYRARHHAAGGGTGPTHRKMP